MFLVQTAPFAKNNISREFCLPRLGNDHDFALALALLSGRA